MKFCCAVLLFASMAFANSGSGLNGNGNLVGATDTASGYFNFYGNGTSITQGVFGDLSASIGIMNCAPCVPTAWPVSLLYLVGSGGGYVNGQVQPWNGYLQFTALSFNSSLGPKGNLVVNWLASGSMYIQIVDYYGIPTGVTYSSNKDWHVRAVFSPSGSGQYMFENATFTTVPEPGTVVLVSTGLLLAFRSRGLIRSRTE